MGTILPRPFNDPGLRVPSIGLGTMGIGGYYERDARRDQEWITCLRKGIEMGLGLIDTAEVYGAGHCEELVGRAMKGRRNEVFLSTKFSAEHSRASQIVTSAECSLMRLKTDWIDLYQPHWPNPAVPFEETARALEQLVQSGKVRYVGLSNFSFNELGPAMANLDPVPIRFLQQEYNLTDRTIEDQLLPYCRRADIKVLAYSPFLQGKMASNDDRRGVLETLAEKYGRSVAQIILAWLCRDDCVIPIPKGSSDAHLQELVDAKSLSLEPGDSELISNTYQPRVRWIPVSEILVQGEGYTTEQQALENRLNFDPSPQALGDSLLRGNMLKPIKVKKLQDEPVFVLTEGKIRFWAWVLAYTGHSAIPAYVEETLKTGLAVQIPGAMAPGNMPESPAWPLNKPVACA